MSLTLQLESATDCLAVAKSFHSFGLYLLTDSYVSGTVLDTRSIRMSKIHMLGSGKFA